MKLIRRRWRAISVALILLVALAAVILGPSIVQFGAFMLAMIACLAIIISGNDGGDGPIPPWYGGGGSGGGL